jgi:hypothetical protein
MARTRLDAHRKHFTNQWRRHGHLPSAAIETFEAVLDANRLKALPPRVRETVPPQIAALSENSSAARQAS